MIFRSNTMLRVSNISIEIGLIEIGHTEVVRYDLVGRKGKTVLAENVETTDSGLPHKAKFPERSRSIRTKRRTSVRLFNV